MTTTLGMETGVEGLDAPRTKRRRRPASGAGRWPAVLAWALFALVLAVFATYPWFDRLARDAGRPDLALLAPFAIPPTLAALTANTVGAVLASRRPRHPVGWLLLAVGLTMAAGGMAAGYVPYGLVVRPGALPAADLLARAYPPLVEATLALLGFVLLLTPTGSPPSPRWHRWAWVSAGTMAVLLVAATLAPGSLDLPTLAVDGPLSARPFGGPLLVVNLAAQALAVVIILAGAGSLVTRFRLARGVERQQLRWLALAAALTGVAMLATGVLIAAGMVHVASWASVLGTIFLPLATGAAILRYRLYDLDRIISRTLAYGLLSLLLGLGYAGIVLGLGGLLAEGSSLVVAGATLGVASAFQPARRRVQAAVDRRFNRRHYDAAETISVFSHRLRQQVDLDTLTAELLAVVEETMQPTQVSLWLRARQPPSTAVGAVMARQRT